MLSHTYPAALALILAQQLWGFFLVFFLNSGSKVSLGHLLLLALLSDPTLSLGVGFEQLRLPESIGKTHFSPVGNSRFPPF